MWEMARKLSEKMEEAKAARIAGDKASEGKGDA